MPFDNSLIRLVRLIDVFARNPSALARSNRGCTPADVVERLRDPHPARQHRDIGDEADVAHELIALGPGVAPEHRELSLVRHEAEDRVQRGRLAGAVGPDEPEDAALFDAQIGAVERDGRAVGLAQAAGFYGCHGFSSPPRVHRAAT